MAINYTAMAETAQRLITENGTPAILRHGVPGVYDPLTNTSTDSSVDYPINIVLVPINTSTQSHDIDLIGKDVYETGKSTKAVIPAADLPTGFVPAIGDNVIILGQTWTIKGLAPIKPAAVAVSHTLYMVQK
jgi:hypothetical protein